MKKVTNAPKWAQKANETIKTLNAKKDRTSFEEVKLVNARLKLEDKSLSKLWKTLKRELSQKEVKNISDLDTFPALKDFRQFAKEGKEFFSLWDGLLMLKKFNKKAKLVKRVKKQGGTITPKKVA